MKKELLISAVTASVLLSPVAHAENQNEGEIKDEIFIKGSSLNEDETQQTKDELDVNDNTKIISINPQEVSEFTNHNYQTIYSSASIKPKKWRSGVDVDIITKDKITDVSEAQYMNAAVSAGIQNANIKIASVNTVTGEGALTGIYKAYQNQDNDLNQQDVQNASEEINDLSSISKNHKNDNNYSDGAMNNAVANMKSDVAKEKEDNKDVTPEKTNTIVDNNLKDKSLDQTLTDDEKQKIKNIIINTSNSNVVNNDPKTFIKQTNHITDKVSDSIKNQTDKLKDSDSKNWFQKLWDNIKSIF